MMLETEICDVVSDVAGVEKKSELEIISTQDLPEPPCSGIGGPDKSCDPGNSYVFVAKADSLSDDLIYRKEAVSVDSLESMASDQFLGVATNDVNGEIDVSFKDGEEEKVAAGDPVEKEISFVDGERLQDTLEEEKREAESGTLIVLNGEVNKPIEGGENDNMEITCRNPSTANGITLEKESVLEDDDVFQDIVKEHIKKPNNWEGNEIKEVEDPSVKIGSSEVTEMEKVDDQHVDIEVAVEAEQKKCADETTSEFSPDIKGNRDSDVPVLGLVSESGEQGELNKLIPASESIKIQDVRKDEINLGSPEEPPLLIEDAIEGKLQEDIDRKIVETLGNVETKVSLTATLDSDLELNSINNKKETDTDAKSALCVADMVIQNWDSVPKTDAQCSLDVEKHLTHGSDCHIGTPTEQIFEGKTNDYSITHLEDSFHDHVVLDKQLDRNGVSPEVRNAETVTEVSVSSQSFSDSGTEDHETLTNIKISDSETVLVASPTSIEGLKSENVNYEIFVHDNSENCIVNVVSSDSYSTGEMTVHIDDLTSFGTQASDVCSEDGDASPHASENLKFEPECHENGENLSVITDLNRSELIDCTDTNPEGKSDIILKEADVNVEGVHLCSETSQKDLVSKTLQEIGGDVRVDAVPKPFNYLIRIPRFSDENLKDQITVAKLEVDEKTRLRDDIQAKIQDKRANNQIHGVDFQYAKDEDRSVRRLVTLKRKEIDSLQSVINKAKNAISVEEMDYRINNMEHMIQHETLALREEKQLIREIKQLKQLREQLSSNMGNQNEIQQALEQRDEAEERLKILKKELGSLKDKVSKARTATVVAESKCDEEHRKVRELQDEFRAADDVRQAAYMKWQSLRKQLSHKNKYFFKYRDVAEEANDYAFSRKREALYHLCRDQVENFMELWNKSSEFRAEYVKFNTRSTVRRFGTLDGRSLGPDEKPYVLPNYVTDERNERMVSISENIDSVMQSSTPEVKQQIDTRSLASDVQSSKNVAEQKNQTATRKVPPKSKRENSLAIVPSWDVSDEEEDVKTKEELELIRKEEEIRRAEAEAKKKEELRLEQLAKAKEAREKKKRNEERMQMKEESRARKEAELKEKEREKKMRKKERKMATAEDNDGGTSEKPVEIINEETPANDNPGSTVNKKHKKPFISRRQSKSKSIPPPLRNRNRRKWQQWMWVSLSCLLIVLLFWLGNMGLFSNVNLKLGGPAF